VRHPQRDQAPKISTGPRGQRALFINEADWVRVDTRTRALYRAHESSLPKPLIRSFVRGAALGLGFGPAAWGVLRRWGAPASTQATARASFADHAFADLRLVAPEAPRLPELLAVAVKRSRRVTLTSTMPFGAPPGVPS